MIDRAHGGRVGAVITTGIGPVHGFVSGTTTTTTGTRVAWSLTADAGR